jgi:hypothetical protein
MTARTQKTQKGWLGPVARWRVSLMMEELPATSPKEVGRGPSQALQKNPKIGSLEPSQMPPAAMPTP